MNCSPAYREKEVAMEMVLAFSLYLEKGLAAVERMYPQHVAFVLQNKDKTKAEIQKELLHKQAA